MVERRTAVRTAAVVARLRMLSHDIIIRGLVYHLQRLLRKISI
jgi:hypothetical protein